jgi:hypothetical protein
MLTSNVGGIVRGIIVVDVDSGARQNAMEVIDDLTNCNCFVVTRHEYCSV